MPLRGKRPAPASASAPRAKRSREAGVVLDCANSLGRVVARHRGRWQPGTLQGKQVKLDGHTARIPASAEDLRLEVQITDMDYMSALQVLDCCAGRPGHEGLTMLHFDAHDDLDLEEAASSRDDVRGSALHTELTRPLVDKLKRLLADRKVDEAWALLNGTNRLDELLPRTHRRQDIASWILPLVLLGYVRKVVFLRPSWGCWPALKDGVSELVVGFSRQGHVRVAAAGPATPPIQPLFADNSIWSSGRLAGAVPLTIVTASFGAKTKALPVGDWLGKAGPERFIFHVDVDCFGAKNPFCTDLEAALKKAKVKDPAKGACQVYDLLVPHKRTNQPQHELVCAVEEYVEARLAGDDGAALARKVARRSSSAAPLAALRLLEKLPPALLLDAVPGWTGRRDGPQRPGDCVGLLEELNPLGMPHHLADAAEQQALAALVARTFTAATKAAQRPPIVAVCESAEFVSMPPSELAAIYATLLPPMESAMPVKFVGVNGRPVLP